MVKIRCKGQIVIYNFTIVQLIRSRKDDPMIIMIMTKVMMPTALWFHQRSRSEEPSQHNNREVSSFSNTTRNLLIVDSP